MTDIFAIENDKINGTYNAVAPKPVSNKTLLVNLAKVMRGKFYLAIHVPALVLQLMLGQRSIEVLKSATVSCKKIIDSGFTFLYPDIDAAIKNLTVKKNK